MVLLTVLRRNYIIVIFTYYVDFQYIEEEIRIWN